MSLEQNTKLPAFKKYYSISSKTEYVPHYLWNPPVVLLLKSMMPLLDDLEALLLTFSHILLLEEEMSVPHKGKP